MGADRPIQERLLQRLAVTYRVADRDLQHIPRKGPVVVVANHPFGILEGAILSTLLGRIRPDVKFLANDILTVIPEIRADVGADAKVSGMPAGPHERTLESYLYLRRQKALHGLVDRLRSRVEELERKSGNAKG